MNILGNEGNNPFDQDLNTYDNVDFTRVDVSGAIIDNSQLATKLYVDTHGGGGGGGDMSYVGTTPANYYIYKSASSDGKSATKSNIVDLGSVVIVNSNLYCSSLDGQTPAGNLNIGAVQNTVTIPATNGIISNKFVKSGGTNIQYLMGDGSTLTQSATSGNSNFYLYKSIDGVTTPPPSSGNIGYNNAVQASATIVYISHLTRDSIDVEVFYNQVNQLNDLYIQDQNSSINFIKYNITGTPTPIPNSYIAIPVVMESYGGTGNTSFGPTHNVLLAFFSNLTEVDQRLSTLETKTFNQTATAGTTNISGTLTANTLSKVGGLTTQFLKADGTVDATSYLPVGTPSIVSGYPFNPTQRATTSITSGTKSYYFTVLLNQATIISGFTVYLDSGSDLFRMGIFRGNLVPGTTITLCGQSAGGSLNATTVLNRVAISAVSGQTLTFNSGEYMTVAFHSQGSTNAFIGSPAATSISVELAWISTANYASAGFPATLTSTAILGPMTARPCFELY
jgi:hypothetical protein